MNKRTYSILEETISEGGIWNSLEVVDDVIYLNFSSVQLFNDKLNHSSEISIRFGDNSLFSIFYNNEEDITFLNNIKVKNKDFLIEFNRKVDFDEFKFQDIDFFRLNLKNFHNEMIFSDNFNMDIDELPDFILSFKSEGILIFIGGNSLNIFNDFEKLDDDDILNLSNKWMRYYISYWIEKSNNKNFNYYDELCELYPLNLGLYR